MGRAVLRWRVKHGGLGAWLWHAIDMRSRGMQYSTISVRRALWRVLPLGAGMVSFRSRKWSQGSVAALFSEETARKLLSMFRSFLPNVEASWWQLAHPIGWRGGAWLALRAAALAHGVGWRGVQSEPERCMLKREAPSCTTLAVRHASPHLASNYLTIAEGPGRFGSIVRPTGGHVKATLRT